jgi:pyridoxal/pyridoxine/pyridoxamine kinase
MPFTGTALLFEEFASVDGLSFTSAFVGAGDLLAAVFLGGIIETKF